MEPFYLVDISLPLNVYSYFLSIRMKKLFEAFEKPNLTDWKAQLIKELKSDNTNDPTSFENEVEELTFTDIYTPNGQILSFNKPNTNDWKIGVELQVVDIKAANQWALKQLNLGANALNFDVTQLQDLVLSELLAGIETAYIYLYFTTKNQEQTEFIRTWFSNKTPLFLQINTTSNLVNTFQIDAIGGNTKQQLAFAFAKGKALLAKNPTEPIHFVFGIGSNFLLEIAKLRAFHILWDRIQKACETHTKTYVTAKTGFVNKSLHDPYTNLLRQTTEGLSAVLGVVDQLIIQPYDLLATTGSSTFTERMAINISLILKEEAEINQWSDPLEGSIVLENYTKILADESWSLFQKIEAKGGMETSEAEVFLHEEIVRTRTKRIHQLNEKKHKMVGVNHYLNTEISGLHWKNESQTFLGMNPLILEQEFEKTLSDKI
jgi:methylmalonyl-CoA mutase